MLLLVKRKCFVCHVVSKQANFCLPGHHGIWQEVDIASSLPQLASSSTRSLVPCRYPAVGTPRMVDCILQVFLQDEKKG